MSALRPPSRRAKRRDPVVDLVEARLIADWDAKLAAWGDCEDTDAAWAVRSAAKHAVIESLMAARDCRTLAELLACPNGAVRTATQLVLAVKW